MYPETLTREQIMNMLEQYTDWLGMQDRSEIRSLSYPEEWVDMMDSDPCWLTRWPYYPAE